MPRVVLDSRPSTIFPPEVRAGFGTPPPVYFTVNNIFDATLGLGSKADLPESATRGIVPPGGILKMSIDVGSSSGTPIGSEYHLGLKATPVSVSDRDFGDAPDTYKTTLAAGGPRYREGELQRFGVNWDNEPDGQPSVKADLDDADPLAGTPAIVRGTKIDDEDGVVFGPNYVDLLVNVTRPGTNTYLLDGWWDTDKNGVFDHPAPPNGAEHYLDLARNLGPGTTTIRHYLSFDPSLYYSRFRLTYSDGPGGLAATTNITPGGEFFGTPDGLSHGEVEDYAPVPAPSASILAVVGLSMVGWIKRRQQRGVPGARAVACPCD